MKIALNLESFFGLHQRGGLDPVEGVHLAETLGVEGVELSDRLIDTSDETDLLRALESTGKSVPACYLFANLLVADAAERSRQIESVCRRFERVRRFAAPVATVIPGAYSQDVDPDEARGWLIEALQQCLPVAQAHGLQLTIENVGFQPNVYARHENLRTICESTGTEMRLVVDAGNFFLVGEDVLTALRYLQSRMVHVHVKDWQAIDPATAPMEIELTGSDGVRYCGVALGEGAVNLPGVVRQLMQMEYHGFLSIEYEGDVDPFDAMRKGVDHLRSLISAATEA